MQVYRLVNTADEMIGALLYSYEEAVKKREEYKEDKRGPWIPYKIQTTETIWRTINEQ